MNLHTIALTDEQMGILNAALVELPFKVAAPVINAINVQLQAAAVKAEQEVQEKLAAKAKK